MARSRSRSRSLNSIMTPHKSVSIDDSSMESSSSQPEISSKNADSLSAIVLGNQNSVFSVGSFQILSKQLSRRQDSDKLSSNSNRVVINSNPVSITVQKTSNQSKSQRDETISSGSNLRGQSSIQQ